MIRTILGVTCGREFWGILKILGGITIFAFHATAIFAWSFSFCYLLLSLLVLLLISYYPLYLIDWRGEAPGEACLYLFELFDAFQDVVLHRSWHPECSPAVAVVPS